MKISFGSLSGPKLLFLFSFFITISISFALIFPHCRRLCLVILLGPSVHVCLFSLPIFYILLCLLGLGRGLQSNWLCVILFSLGLWFVRPPLCMLYILVRCILWLFSSLPILWWVWFLLSFVGCLVFLLSFVFQPLLLGFSASVGFLYIRFLFLISVFHWQICMLFGICFSFLFLHVFPCLFDFFIVSSFGGCQFLSFLFLLCLGLFSLVFFLLVCTYTSWLCSCFPLGGWFCWIGSILLGCLISIFLGILTFLGHLFSWSSWWCYGLFHFSLSLWDALLRPLWGFVFLWLCRVWLVDSQWLISPHFSSCSPGSRCLYWLWDLLLSYYCLQWFLE